MNIKQINTEIIQGTWTNAELMSMIDAIKFKRKLLTETVKRSITLGDTVSFTSSKTGRTSVGTVTKIAIKYITVNTGAGLWRVPASMLTVVDKETV